MTQRLKPLRVLFQVTLKRNEKEYIPIKDVTDWDKRSSHWLFTKRFYELRVARYWYLTPGQWDKKEEEEKSEMIASYNLENKMADYDSLLREKELDRKNRLNRNL